MSRVRLLSHQKEISKLQRVEDEYVYLLISFYEFL